jgi:hypothetical protein
MNIATKQDRRNLIIFSLCSLRFALLSHELPRSLNIWFPTRVLRATAAADCRSSLKIDYSSKKGIVPREAGMLLPLALFPSL